MLKYWEYGVIDERVELILWTIQLSPGSKTLYI